MFGIADLRNSGPLEQRTRIGWETRHVPNTILFEATPELWKDPWVTVLHLAREHHWYHIHKLLVHDHGWTNGRWTKKRMPLVANLGQRHRNADNTNKLFKQKPPLTSRVSKASSGLVRCARSRSCAPSYLPISGGCCWCCIPALTTSSLLLLAIAAQTKHRQDTGCSAYYVTTTDKAIPICIGRS